MDHILIHDEKHLQHVATEYTAYFNQERPHQGIEQRIPDHFELSKSKPTDGRISAFSKIYFLYNIQLESFIFFLKIIVLLRFFELEYQYS